MNVKVLLACLGVTAVLLGGCGNGATDETPPTRSIPVTTERTPNVAGTVISSFGKLEPFDSFESAELRLGWRIMRPRDARFRLVQQGGMLRTHAAVGLPRLEQNYAVDGRRGLISIIQAPEAYDLRVPAGIERVTIGGFEGDMRGKLPHAAFLFFSGEQVRGQRIRVDVSIGDDFTMEEFAAFITSLTFAAP